MQKKFVYVDPICVCVCGDKKADFINDKVHDLIFCFTILKETEYISVLQLHNSITEWILEMQVWGS